MQMSSTFIPAYALPWGVTATIRSSSIRTETLPALPERVPKYPFSLSVWLTRSTSLL